MVLFEWFDSPLIKATVVFLISIFLITALYMVLRPSKNSKKQDDVLISRHLLVMKDLEQKIKYRKRDIDLGIPLKEQIRINKDEFLNSKAELSLEVEKYSADILKNAVYNLKTGKDAEGAKYLISACIMWKNNEKLGKLLMALPILADILANLSAEDFNIIISDSGFQFSAVTEVLDFVLASNISPLDRRIIVEAKKCILVKVLNNL